MEAECFASDPFLLRRGPHCGGRASVLAEEVDALKVPAVGAGRTGIYIESIEKAMKLTKTVPSLPV
ncbi:MAG: hypothetical protein ACLTYN_03955 [Dysosmobacter welbionis]